MSISASSVSAVLRRNGFLPVTGNDRRREGIRVTNGLDSVRVVADLNSAAQAKLMAVGVAETLETAGYRIKTDDAVVWVYERDQTVQ